MKKMIPVFLLLISFSHGFAGQTEQQASSQLASIKLKVELKMGTNEKASDTLVLPNGEWVAKNIGTYAFKAKAQPKGLEAVTVEMELKGPGNEKAKRSTIITKWDASPATIESKNDDGQLLYRVSVIASKNVLDDSER